MLVYNKGHFHNILSNTPYAEYLLMKEEFKEKQEENPRFKQLNFNTLFLKTMKEIRGKLICVFCGKDNLVIYDRRDRKKNYSIMATADHFFPKSKGGEAYDFKNMVVACNECNCKKADKIYPVETLKFLKEYGIPTEQFERIS